MIRVKFGFLVFTILIALPGLLHANDIARAKRSFKKGQTLFENQRFDEASAAFSKAMELSPTWKLHYNIAQCEAAAKRYGTALDHFEKYMAGGGDDIPVERMEEVLAETARLRQMVGTVVFNGAQEGYQLYVDNELRGTFPLTLQIRLTAGAEHDIRVVDGNTVLLHRKLTPGATQTISLDISSRDAEATEQSPDSSESPEMTVVNPAVSADESRLNDTGQGSQGTDQMQETSTSGKPQRLMPLKVAFWVSLSTAVVSTGVGVGFSLAAGAAKDDFDARNSLVKEGEILPTDSELLKLRDNVKRYDAISIGTLIGAGVLVSTAVIAGSIFLLKKKRLSNVSATPFGLQVRF